MKTEPLPGIREPSALRLILTLGLAGLVSGLIIVTAYHATRPPTPSSCTISRLAAARREPGW